VDVEPLAARHATEVLLDAARVRVDREFVAGAAKLSLELPDGALGVQVEQAALPLLAELLVELSLELDLLLVGHRLHSPTDVANLRGELAVRGLERGPDLDSILGLHELCLGLRDEWLDRCVLLSLLQLHVDLQ